MGCGGGFEVLHGTYDVEDNGCVNGGCLLFIIGFIIYCIGQILGG